MSLGGARLLVLAFSLSDQQRGAGAAQIVKPKALR